MDALFISRVVLSFFIAGSWIALVTLLAERLGSRLGGLFTAWFKNPGFRVTQGIAIRKPLSGEADRD